jgi:hypothetical protein
MNRTPFAIALALFWAASAPAQRTNYKPLPPFAVPDTIEVRHVDT